MKRLELSVLIAVVFCTALSFSALNVECSEIRSSVLRMHILANSDDEEDQVLKLEVRDRLLEISDDLYSDAQSRDEAIAVTEENLDYLQAEAAEVISEQGYDYSVKVELEETYFTTRTYGDITLPAGNYTALRVVIGEGEGHNWWCVMFPPLCISAASDSQTQLEDVLSDGELDLVEGTDEDYEIKFKCVELYEELMQYLSGDSEQ